MNETDDGPLNLALEFALAPDADGAAAAKTEGNEPAAGGAGQPAFSPHSAETPCFAGLI
jgi:hypothetical protein